MRSVSGARNRLALIVAGLVACAAAAWLSVAVLDLNGRWPQAESWLPDADSTIAVIAAHHRSWLLPVTAVLSVVAALVGLALLLAQVPSRPAVTTLRVLGEDGAELGSLEPAVLERALTERLEDLVGVVDASVHLSGAATERWLQASVTLEEEAEVDLAAGAVRRLLAEDAAEVLGVPVRQVDLLVRLQRSAAPARTTLVRSGSADPTLRHLSSRQSPQSARTHEWGSTDR